jgi:2-oxo-4-hydroxy-4-carboxy-5-ureidoimidazoline decarboxylase
VRAEPHAWLNALSQEAAAGALKRCCGADAWVERMVALRPFASRAALYTAAELVWRALSVSEQLEAYTHHPRIGAQTVSAVSREEQAVVAVADPQLLAALHAGNVAYQERFGFVFLVCATGKSAPEMLASLRERLTHDRERELKIAAAEHAKITRIRLEGLGA